MTRSLFIYLVLFTFGAVSPAPESSTVPGATAAPAEARLDADDEPPEGYYAFVMSPNATPPRVRGPPYRQVSTECDDVNSRKPHVSASNLCGDLNKGVIPRNPMKQNPGGEPYPFELLRNHTLRFLSRALPVLRADPTLPRVAHLPPTATPSPTPSHYDNHLGERNKRAADDAMEVPAGEDWVQHESGAREIIKLDDDDLSEQEDYNEPRAAKFCEGGGVFCMLLRAINGDASAAERRDDPPRAAPAAAAHTAPRYEGPPTPCPARVEYATPVFARNYQGLWRYVVQIPYEGYFTQTVELTRCMSSRCHYLEGGCLSSPRWASLLVGELHYPQSQESQQFSTTHGTDETTEKPTHCDGHDEMGCYQVRLYYDWFLVPGSCKCWRPDYFARYVRRRDSSDL